MQRWQEHFGEILSASTASTQDHENDINATEHPLAINENPTNTRKYLVKAIKQFETGKAVYIIKLQKKDDLSNCKNWRGITLLNYINKFVATIIH